MQKYERSTDEEGDRTGRIRPLLVATGGLDVVFRRLRGNLPLSRQHGDLMRAVFGGDGRKCWPLRGRYCLQRWLVVDELLVASDLWFGGAQVTVRLLRGGSAAAEARTVRWLCARGGEYAHIAPVLDAFDQPPLACLVYPRHDRTLLDAFDVSVRSIRQHAFQLVTALAFLERHRCPHGRLRHTSVLVSDERASLVGFTQPGHDDSAHSPPELQPSARPRPPPAHAADIWALATILVELYGSAPLFDPARPAESIAAFCAQPPHARFAVLYRKLKSLHCPDFIFFLIACLEHEPAARITAVQALRHPFFYPVLPLALISPSPEEQPVNDWSTGEQLIDKKLSTGEQSDEKRLSTGEQSDEKRLSTGEQLIDKRLSTGEEASRLNWTVDDDDQMTTGEQSWSVDEGDRLGTATKVQRKKRRQQRPVGKPLPRSKRQRKPVGAWWLVDTGSV